MKDFLLVVILLGMIFFGVVFFAPGKLAELGVPLPKGSDVEALTQDVALLKKESSKSATPLPVTGATAGAGQFALTEEFPKGTTGGDCTGFWKTRKLNTVIANQGERITAIDKKSGAVILAPGSYACTASAPAYRVGAHKVILFDITSSAALMVGTSEFSPDTTGAAQTTSSAVGAFKLEKPTSIALFHSCEKTPADAEKGRALGVPGGKFDEVYAVLHCTVLQ